MTVLHNGLRSGLLRNWQSGSVQIASGAAISGSMLLAGRTLASLGMPEFWTAASLSFDVVMGPISTCNWYPLTEDGAEVSVNGNASQVIAGSPLHLLNSVYGFRIRSGSLAAETTNQGSARTITFFMQG